MTNISQKRTTSSLASTSWLCRARERSPKGFPGLPGAMPLPFACTYLLRWLQTQCKAHHVQPGLHILALPRERTLPKGLPRAARRRGVAICMGLMFMGPVFVRRGRWITLLVHLARTGAPCGRSRLVRAAWRLACQLHGNTASQGASRCSKCEHGSHFCGGAGAELPSSSTFCALARRIGVPGLCGLPGALPASCTAAAGRQKH